MKAKDHGHPVTLQPSAFARPQRGGGWGSFAESFERINRSALAALDVSIQFGSGPEGATVQLVPGGRTGAVPLRSGQTGHVVGGFLVEPRFGWPGVGQVLAETGWHALPEFPSLPLVPGSAREVPPWVLAGPVLARLSALLRSLRRSYHENEAILSQPRGRILWDRYRAESLSRGHWHRIPCRFPDLAADPLLRRHIRWATDRIHRDLLLVGGRDPIALGLAGLAALLLEQLIDVPAQKPRRDELQRRLVQARAVGDALQRGIEALGWIVDERGLGGGRQSDGLAWSLPLDGLWESYVESWARREAAKTGATVKVARLGETVFRLDWSEATHRSLGHLAPDIVVRRGRSVQIIDAKYKAHLVELDEHGWRRFAEETREAHRADLHQVLAYAGLFEADDVTATLVYPLRRSTWEALRDRERDVSRADLLSGGRTLRLELRGLPFGRPFSR
jgi:McrBC 5-methylcytosine restriction system component